MSDGYDWDELSLAARESLVLRASDGARVVEGSFDVFEGAVVIYVDTPGLLVIPLPDKETPNG